MTPRNNTLQALDRYETACLGNAEEQLALGAHFAEVSGLDAEAIVQALARLTIAVEGTLRQMDEEGEGKSPSQATRLVALALDVGAELFHAPDGEAYASIKVGGHAETWPLKVKGFRHWLARQFYEAEGKAPGSQAVQDALGVLEGKAL